MSTQTPAKLYRVKAVMAQLGISRATVYRLVADNKLTLVKIGKRSSGITAASVDRLTGEKRAIT